jgi:Fe-S cluster assembly iron-binding protein IscA
MLMLTRDAADAIKGLTEAPLAEGVRISTDPQSLNGHGPGLRIGLAQGPEAHDAVVEAEGARIYLEPGAAQALDHKILDAEVEDDEVRFAVLEEVDEGGID